MKRAFALCAIGLCLVACATVRSYEGGPRPADEVARISGDFHFTAGVPVSVILRKVDDYPLRFGERTVEVLPGKHRLLVDCRIAETSSTTRLSVDVEVYAGERYRLVAETGPGLKECTSVSLEPID
ncbi:MAG: hypothetical protein C0P74_004595 [Gammaproteobacteria bacterium]|nr:hypothetical protein [Gammaproteobacteria bacterium]